MSCARRRLLAALAPLTAAVAGCDGAPLIPPSDETPTVALLITPDPTRGLFDPTPDSGLFAVLVETGTPLRSPYLVADRFEMRRVADGARFAWRAAPTQTDAIAVVSFARGNYFLPRAVSAEGLGSDSIVPGAEYELVVEVGRHRISGRTRVPGSIEFVREPTDGDTIVRWRRVPGAHAYIGSGSYYAAFLTGQPIADTVLNIGAFPRDPSAPAPRIRIYALDTNYAAFLREPRASQAGLTGGWGVFGAFTWAETELPPPSTASARR